jgi:hypothetical protein
MRTCLRPFDLRCAGGRFSFRLASSAPNAKADLDRMRNIGISGNDNYFALFLLSHSFKQAHIDSGVRRSIQKKKKKKSHFLAPRRMFSWCLLVTCS